MTDPIRDQIRSLIATIVEDRPDPIPFEDVRAMTSARRAPGRGPLLAPAVFVAVLVMVGFVALLRPPADIGPVVTDPTSTTTDAGPVVESGGLTMTRVRVGELPAGLVLEVWEGGFQPFGGSLVSFGPGAGWSGPGPRPQLTVVTHSLMDRPTLDTLQVLERLQSAHGTDSVTEMTVRARPAFIVERPDQSDGWTVALLVLESAELVSEVQAEGLDAADVVAAAVSLRAVDADTSRQEAIDEIGWDLRVLAASEDTETYRQGLLQVDGVEQVTLRTPWFGSRDLFFEAQSDSAPTTTSADAQPADTVRAFEYVEALVHLDDNTDIDAVAAVISELEDSVRIGFSPAIATSRTLAFLDQLLAGAELIHDDPPIHQPIPGASPNFDTSDLGIDVPLHPATADDVIPARLVEAILSPPGFPRPTEPEPMAGPFFHLGRLDDGSRLLAAFGGAYPEYFVWHYMPHLEGFSTSGAGSSLAGYGYGVTGASSGPGDAHYVFISVPLNTAVYTYELSSDTRYQQQPVGGHGVLPLAAQSGTVTAYDQDGNILGRWQR
jgi:hypothetical protein